MEDFKEKDGLMMTRLFMDKWERLPDEVDQDGEVPLTQLLDWMQNHYDACMNLGLHRVDKE
jgi:hypothetical protein